MVAARSVPTLAPLTLIAKSFNLYAKADLTVL
jgi:hypothetical protein